MVPPGYSSGETAVKVMKSSIHHARTLAALPERQSLYFQPHFPALFNLARHFQVILLTLRQVNLVQKSPPSPFLVATII